ncbi:Arginase family [Puniceibacterium sp. IMCC21224]|nr:Arginase family [Puniceibacterium sp. IMCC21224]
MLPDSSSGGDTRRDQGYNCPIRRLRKALLVHANSRDIRGPKAAVRGTDPIQQTDAFCPSIPRGTGTPSHGGFLYYEVLDLLQIVARRHKIIGINLVEVAPDYDPAGSTSILAAQVLLNLLGFIFHAQPAE